MNNNITLIFLVIFFNISLSFSQNGKDLFDKGKILLDSGKCNDALAYFDKAIKKDSTLAEVPIFRAKTNICLDKNEAAKKDLEKAKILNENNPQNLIIIAHIEIYIKRPDLEPDFVKTPEINLHLPPVPKIPKEKFVIHFKGAESSDNQYEELLNLYDKVISLKPDFAEAYYDRGFIKFINEKLDDAIKDFDKAISINRNMKMRFIAGMKHYLL